MSLAFYEPTTSAEPMDFTPLVFGMGIVLASAILNAATSDEDELDDDIPREVGVQTDSPVITEVKTGPKKNSPEDPLDITLLDILERMSAPLTAREIVGLLEGVDRRQVNSRLYTLYGKKKIQKWDTEGAPHWFV